MRNGLRSFALFLLLASSPALAQDWTADGGADRQREIVRRYLEILEARPENEIILDRLMQTVGDGLTSVIDDYRERVAADPDDYPAHVLLGVLLERTGSPAEAVAPLLRAAELQPDTSLPQTTLGLVYRALDRREESAAAMERALELAADDDERREILRTLADLSFEERDFVAAGEWVARLVDIDPNDVQTRMELAELYIRYEQFDAALEQYNAIIDMAGGDTRQRAMAMKDVGDVLALMGRSDEAIESYRSAMRLVEEGYWLHRELQQGIINVYRSENRLVELLDELEADWSSPDFAQLMLLASLYEETGRDDRALETVERAVREQPSSVDARLALIRMLERRGESDRVVEEYETLIRRNPGDSTYRFRLVDVLRRSGDREAAIEVLAEIADRFSSDSSVLIEVADRYMRFRESEPAGVIYERLVRIDPDNPDNWIALGEYQFMESRRSEAERSWREILARISPEDEAHAELADVFANHGLVEEAIVELEEARAIAPENDGYLRTLAELYQRADRLPQAQRLWEQILATTTQDHLRAEARTALVSIWESLGQLPDVAARMRAQFDADNTDLSSGYLAAEAAIKLGDTDGAELLYVALADLDVTSIEALQALERLFSQQNRIEDAISVLRRIVERAPNRARETYQRLAELSLRVYRDEEAVEFARLGVELNPDDANGYARLGDVYRQMRDLDAAVDAYRSALELDPRAVVVSFRLAEVYTAMDQIGAADEIYRQVMAEAQDEAQILRSGRRTVQIHQSLGTLEELVGLIEPHIYDPRLGPAYLKLLVELFDAWVSPLTARARHTAGPGGDAAREELERVARRALRPLLDAVSGEDIGLRSTALRVLVSLDNPAGAVALARLIAEGDDEVERRESALAVARSADGRAVQPLLVALEGAEPSLQPLVVYALSRIGSADAVAALAALSEDSARAPEQRALAVLGVGRASDGWLDGVDVIAGSLADESPTVQVGAILAAAYAGRRDLAERIALFVEFGRGDAARAAALALAVLGDPGILTECVGAASDDLRSACATALARAGGTIDDEAVVSVEATLAFVNRSTGAIDVTRYLNSVLDAVPIAVPDDVAERYEALRAPLVASFRVGLTQDHDRAVQTLRILATVSPVFGAFGAGLEGDALEAAAATANAVRNDLVDAIAAQSTATSPEVRRAAVDALAQIGGSSVAAAALRARLSDEDATVSVAALRALGTLGDSQAAGDALVALGSDDWRAREAACTVLGQLRRAGAEVEAAALGDASLAVRLAAWTTLFAVSPSTAEQQMVQSWAERVALERLEGVRWAVESGQGRAILELGSRDANAAVRETSLEALRNAASP